MMSMMSSLMSVDNGDYDVEHVDDVMIMMIVMML